MLWKNTSSRSIAASPPVPSRQPWCTLLQVYLSPQVFRPVLLIVLLPGGHCENGGVHEWKTFDTLLTVSRTVRESNGSNRSVHMVFLPRSLLDANLQTDSQFHDNIAVISIIVEMGFNQSAIISTYETSRAMGKKGTTCALKRLVTSLFQKY